MYLFLCNNFPLVLRHCMYFELNFNFLLNKFSEKRHIDVVFADFLDFRSDFFIDFPVSARPP